MTDEPDYSLVMPFVTCTDAGGPHDPESYVAGYEMATLDHSLRVGRSIEASTFRRTIRDTNVQQADLIAMRHGYRLRIVDTEWDEWKFAFFRRAF